MDAVPHMPNGLEQSSAIRRATRARLPWFLAALVFVAVVLATLLIWRPMQTAAHDDARAAFESRAAEVSAAIATRIATYELALQSARAQVLLNREMDQAHWQSFVQMLDLERHNPGLLGLGFAAQVSGDQLPGFLAQARLSSAPQFALVPGGARAQYVPITWFSMLNSAAGDAGLGVDLYADPVCRVALQTARDQGRPVLSAPLQNPTADAGPTRVLLFLPVYRGGSEPRSLEARHAALLGFVMASLRVDRMMADILGEAPLGVDFALYDASDDQAPLFSDNRLVQGNEPGSSPAFTIERQLPVAGRRWSVRYTADTDAASAAAAERAQTVLHGGIVTALLLAAIAWLLATTRVRANLLGEERAAAYRDSEQRLRTITDSVPGLVSHLDRDGQFLFVNRAHFDWYGLKPGAFIGKTFAEVFGAEAPRDPAVDALVARGHAGERGSVRSWIPQAGRWVHVSVVPDGAAGVYMLLVDVSALKAAEEALFDESDRARTALRAIADAVIVTNIVGQISSLNPAAESITGWPESEAMGRQVDEVFVVVSTRSGERVAASVQNVLDQGATASLADDAVLSRRDGATVPISGSAASIHDAHGNVSGAVLVFRDVSASRELAMRMAHLAQHDALTNLPNRVMLEDRLRQAIALAERNARMSAVLFIDLDRFKSINDTLGHQAGDQLLCHVAERLCAGVRRSDTVCRLGGDEFVVLLPEVGGVRDVAQVAGKLLTALQEPMTIDGQELHLSGSIGISVYPGDGAIPHDLLKSADAAMYHAKHAGRNQYAFFTPEIEQHEHARLQVETLLHEAIDSGQLRLHYQPKVDAATRRLVGLEALVRWQRSESELIYPCDFLPIAETSDLIMRVDAWVMRAACLQIRSWQDQGLPPIPVSVNVSVVTFTGEQLVTMAGEALVAAGIAPDLLQIEITESQLLRNTERTRQVLSGLKRLGIGVAIDDFGSGYSSLSYLYLFAVDVLKLDRSLVTHIADDPRQAVIVQAITTMARSLGYRVIAEGVEREVDAQALHDNGCDELQGYLFSRPLPEEACRELMRGG